MGRIRIKTVLQMPINELPQDILEDIFFHAVNGTKDGNVDRKRLLFTCRLWYKIVVAQVRLWTTISWSRPAPGTVQCPNVTSFAQIIERTGNADLDLTFDLPTCRTEASNFDLLALVIREQSLEDQKRPHCRSLTLTTHPLLREYDPAKRLEAMFGPAPYNFESLQCLVLRHVCYDQDPGTLSVFLDGIAASAKNLYRLEIDYSEDTTLLEELFSRLTIQQRIRELMLPIVIGFSVPWHAMRGLTDLHITKRNSDWLQFISVNLSKLDAPNLRRLHIEGDLPVNHLPSRTIIKQATIKLVDAPPNLRDALVALGACLE